MKTLGLIGGMSWVSTAEYYKLINQEINDRLGGVHAAQCIIYSFNYDDIKRNNEANDWEKTFTMLSTAGRHLKYSGADALLLCANTMHLIADRVAAAVQLPLIHIATATAAAIKHKGLKRVGLLGTKFTMEEDFFKVKLQDQQIQTLIPADDDRSFLHQTIFNELGKGVFHSETKQRYLTIIQQLINKGAEGIILGCTEIPLLLQQKDVPVPVFDTTLLHSRAAVDFALG